MRMASRAPDLKARNQLVEQYRPYVRSIASKIRKTVASHIDYEDLVLHGEIGLIEAADRFDPKVGANFKTFAYYRIRGAIYDGLREMGWLSRSQYARQKFQEAANHYLSTLSGSSPPLGGSSIDAEVVALTQTVAGLVPIFITSIETAEALQIEDEREPSPAAACEMGESRAAVLEAIEELPQQEKTVIKMYYFKDLTLQEVSDKMGLSKSWASRLHSRAVRELQRLVAKKLGTEVPEQIHRRNKKSQRADK